MSKQPPNAPTASAIVPCPTIIQINRTPRHCKLMQPFRATQPPLRRKIESTNRHHYRHHQRQPGEQRFPTQWSSASSIFNNYFYLFLYLYVTRITINNNTPHLKSPKNQNRRAALGRPAMKLLGGFNSFAVDQPSPLVLLSSTKPYNAICSSTNATNPTK